MELIFILMWSYYGAKTNLIDLYPKPEFDSIVEPFAGSARYSLKYFDRDILLIDKYPVVVRIWQWLQKCSEKDVLSTPRLKPGQTLNDVVFDCEEQKWFTSFIHGCGDIRPRLKPTGRKTVDRPNHVNYNLKRVATHLFKIRNWKIIEGEYSLAPNKKATWFIDPPYQYGGSAYVMSSKKIDFNSLAPWCKERIGQVIVCENTKANWMDFKPVVKQRGTLFTTTEAIWSNRKTNYDIQQSSLFV